MQYSKHSTDEELIQGCRQKNRLAQKYLYQRFYGKMFGISMRYTKQKSEAIDVLNQAFLKVFEKIDQYEPNGSFSGWIARIVFNTSIDYVRRNTLYKEVMDFNTEKETAMDAKIMDRLFAEDLYQMIQQLPTTSRTVFSLYVIDGYKHREIAELLNISANTSKWHLAEARKKLQKQLKNYQRRSISSLRKIIPIFCF